MFTLHITAEDTTIDASSDDGLTWNGVVKDTFTHTSRSITCTGEQIAAISQLALHPDGTGLNTEGCYTLLEPLFKDWPNNLRPIP